jgi:hypothetical protein
MTFLNHVLRRRAIVFLLTDFLHSFGAEAVRNPSGRVEDAETGELLELDSGRASVRGKFARVNAERLAELDLAFNRAGVDTLRFSTAEGFAPALQHFFETRRGRRRG